MKPRIQLLTGSHLCNNPRVMKEAQALAESGLDVTILGCWVEDSFKSRDQALLTEVPYRFVPVLDLCVGGIGGRARRLAARIRTKLGIVAHRALGLSNRLQLGYPVDALRAMANVSEADLSIAHSEVGLFAAADLLSRGRMVGVDLEDWFSEDLLPEARTQRPISLLRRLEGKLLNDASHTSCPSASMSRALADDFKCRAPIVVYNAFPFSDRLLIRGDSHDRRDVHVPSLYWYSQTLGQGRGLEDLFKALPYVKRPLHVHLRGRRSAGADVWLNSIVPHSWRDHVFVHELVSNEQVLSRIAEHDIGFAGEMTYCRNKDLTVSNKILHYLVGGLAVIASDTAGQREVAALARKESESDGPILLYRAGDALSLSVQLNSLLESNERLNGVKRAAVDAAQRVFCWERQSHVLVESVWEGISGRL